MKELKLRPLIGEHDLNVRVKQAKKWFSKKHRVKVTVRFRGRQHKFMETLGPETIEKFLALLGEHVVVNPTRKVGKQYTVVIRT